MPRLGKGKRFPILSPGADPLQGSLINVEMAHLYEDISDLSQPRIRLLTVEPSSNPLAQVVCTLATYSITSTPQYEALSYVWGDASNREDVCVNGFTMSITQNLYSALRMLRDPTSPLTVWADAICIDQGNLNERSSQVQLMGDIYRTAEGTLIWLGFEDHASEVVIQICREVQDAYLEDTPMPPIIASQARLEALLEFFKRPWWVRSWVIQELCLAKNPVLIIGGMQLPWRYFSLMVAHIGDEITANARDSLNAMLHLIRSEGFVAARGLRNKRNEISIGEKEVTLLDTLVEFRVFATTDRRDKVYALLGLISRPLAGIEPDYTIPANEVYTQAAKAILNSTKDLTLLESLHMFERFRDPGLPSWVPQWDGEANQENPGEKVPSHIRAVTHSSRQQFDPKIPPLNASKSYYVTRLEFPGPNILALDGYFWDNITAIGEPLNFPTKIHEDMSQEAWKGSAGNLVAFFITAFQGLGHVNDAMSSWHSLAINKRPYPSGQDRKEAFIRTVYGPLADLAASTANFDLAFETHVPGGVVGGVSTLLGAVSKISKTTITGLLSMRKTTTEKSFDCLPNCYDKRLAITSLDYMALIPKTATVGDKIALMPGADKPFLLRSDGERFKVIGNCYVQGIMHGEAWDPRKMRRMEFS